MCLVHSWRQSGPLFKMDFWFDFFSRAERNEYVYNVWLGSTYLPTQNKLPRFVSEDKEAQGSNVRISQALARAIQTSSTAISLLQQTSSTAMIHSSIETVTLWLCIKKWTNCTSAICNSIYQEHRWSLIPLLFCITLVWINICLFENMSKCCFFKEKKVKIKLCIILSNVPYLYEELSKTFLYNKYTFI